MRPVMPAKIFRTPFEVNTNIGDRLDGLRADSRARRRTLQRSAGVRCILIRLPGYVIGVEAISGAQDERLTIRHDARSGAEPDIRGTLPAIRRARNHVGLVRGLDKICCLHQPSLCREI